MPRTKERRKIIHKPSSHELFYCLEGMPSYSKILLEYRPDKSYKNFLRWLLEKDFYKNRTEKISIKGIAKDFMTDTVKVTKWLKEIYEEIFELNFDKPELFQDDGVKVCLYMKHYDNSCSFYTTFPFLPKRV